MLLSEFPWEDGWLVKLRVGNHKALGVLLSTRIMGNYLHLSVRVTMEQRSGEGTPWKVAQSGTAYQLYFLRSKSKMFAHEDECIALTSGWQETLIVLLYKPREDVTEEPITQQPSKR